MYHYFIAEITYNQNQSLIFFSKKLKATTYYMVISDKTAVTFQLFSCIPGFFVRLNCNTPSKSLFCSNTRISVGWHIFVQKTKFVIALQ